MTDRRDQVVAVAAVGLLAVLAGLVVTLMRDAQQSGIATREAFRTEQVGQLAASMDTRVQQAYSSLATTVGSPGRWNLTLRDPADAAALRPTSPSARTGSVLLDHDGTIVNGSLLRDESVLGTRDERQGIEDVLGGEAAVLPVGPGLTTPDPVLGIAIPVRDASGSLAGAFVIETEVATESAFSEEIEELGSGDSASFSFVDVNKRVVASSDETTLARDIGLDDELLEPGIHRADGWVYAVADVPAAGWTLVFSQTIDDFQGDLTDPLRSALILVLVVAGVGGATSVLALLRRLRVAREEQRRLAEISSAREEFTSIVSHELRTPVAGLLGFLQTTLDHWEVMSDDERRRAVGRAQQNAERLQHLTVEVLDTTSVETGQARFHTEQVDMREVVTHTVETSRDANPGRLLEIELPDRPVLVEADAPRLRQVLTNVLDNALKSSPLDAPVTVTLSGGDSATVAVRDRGPGIPAADRERVFEKFTRGRSGLTRGSGLGLFLAREIMHAHDGRIWIADGGPDGVGTTVLFSLPTVRPDGA